MKNKIKTYLYICLSAGILSSGCTKDFLNKNPTDKIPESTFWKTQADADLALSGVYEFLCRGYNATSSSNARGGWGGASMFWDGLSDDAFVSSTSNNFNTISRGGLTSTTGGIQAEGYEISYQAIAACNRLIANIDRITSMSQQDRDRYSAEARFIRAHYYFLLTNLYGDVPLTLAPLGMDDASAKLGREAKDKVIETILADLDYASEKLPNTAYKGHAVRGAALGYKTRVLLTQKKWVEAAAAAKIIIDENKFSIYQGGYRDLFRKPGQTNNPEIMFSARFLPPNMYSPADMMYSYLKTIQPLSYLVDSYYCVDGKNISTSAQYDPKNPFENRDPRLKASIIYRGVWRGTTASSAFDPVAEGVLGGFLPRKYINEAKWPTSYATQSDQDWVFLRYADILLMYAEAKNESTGPEQTAVDALNQVRSRADVKMPLLQFGPGLTKEEFRNIIRQERRVELALEGQRYFDLKRWGSIKKVMDAIKDPTGASRIFRERDTLWPVPQSEVDIAKSLGNDKFTQTKGF
ncbi:RagB/SusD family nutrient uptake outer membrane protein [Sphingobacterium sp. HMA12]|uniref:RagB/SusD family nutrient uptake outer membrane protein n=1 Tax=Sphingobacterium sp. HMA12 TaxID=2050894 RepID=UPI000CE9F354|nr:RagB/SusD family nutrient uptake outer membrane protein [Sphingobacterium sp. HMA12]